MDHLSGLNPILVDKIHRVLIYMASQGHGMRICQGLRTVAQQQELFAQGRTKPGKRVTNCDGVVKKSRHQQAADGFGKAVDCCFNSPDPFGIKNPWDVFGKAVEAEGLVWGGRFSSPVDLDHAELP